MAYKAEPLSAEDHARVSAAVTAAESGTSGEIVTIVSDHSDMYHDVSLWWSSVMAVLALASVAAWPNCYLNKVRALFGDWHTDARFSEILEIALAVTVLTFIIVRLLMLWRPLRMALTPDFIEDGRVRRRAIQLFKVGAEARTVGRTGILIYLSMLERRAEIIADEAIHKIVAPEIWGEAMIDMLAHVRKGQIADGMIAAIRDVGAILEQSFPRAADDKDELPDRLIEL